ncbi:MAG TPA: SWIM zinc finger family protein [Chthoniobacteraceae bacterium]|nr:SWIM zinc finger family protein [Chthoniobacteraceae bacterium]
MSWHSYEDARVTKADVQREIERRRKRGEAFDQLTLSAKGARVATTFWGAAWCHRLETYQDYENRLQRGRTYLRQGNVYDLEIKEGLISAVVAGAALYEVNVRIKPLSKEEWEQFKNDCAGKVSSLLDLLGGNLGEGVLTAITDFDRGLFPQSREIRFSCTCPDHAEMCKHAAAVLYGVGAKLDAAPELFFVLRSVDPTELLADTARQSIGAIIPPDDALAGEDLSTLFGIELAPDVRLKETDGAKNGIAEDLQSKVKGAPN